MSGLVQSISISFYTFLYNLPEIVYSILAFALLLQIFIFLKQFENQILINISFQDTSPESKAKQIYKRSLIHSIRATLAVLTILYFFKLFT